MLVEQLSNLNQFKVFLKNGVVFQSYSSLIALKRNDGRVLLSPKWNYSRTALKHLKVFLRNELTSKEIEKLIKDGVYILVSEIELLEEATR